MLKRSYRIVLVGTSFRSAPLELREKLSRSVNVNSLQNYLDPTRNEESFALLSTCNRIEIYAWTEDAESTEKRLRDYLTGLEKDAKRYLYSFHDEDAVEQIIRVACGMDSMVLGEPQILLQVKHAKTLTHNGSGNMITELVHHAYTAGIRIRREAGIDAAYSIGSAAADLVISKLTHKPNLLILGGGKMATSTVKELRRDQFGEIHIANRTPSKALSQQFEDIRIHPLTEAQALLSKVDAVIVATSSPQYLVTAETLKGRKTGKRLILVDISIPRNVDPNLAGVPNLKLYNIDDLSSYIKTTLKREQVDKAQRMIVEETRKFSSELSALEVAPVIRSVRTRAEEIRREEAEKALKKLSGVKERDAEVLTVLSSHIVNRLLHEPTTRMREHAKNGDSEEYGRVFRDLFGIDD